MFICSLFPIEATIWNFFLVIGLNSLSIMKILINGLGKNSLNTLLVNTLLVQTLEGVIWRFLETWKASLRRHWGRHCRTQSYTTARDPGGDPGIWLWLWSTPGWCGPLGSVPAVTMYVSLSFSFSFFLYKSAFQKS